MLDYRLFRRIQLRPSHRPTGRTRHYRDDKLLPPPSELRIVQYPEDPGFYLLYCDDSGIEMTDTYHDALEGALNQAEWELQVKPGEWEVVDQP